MTNEAEDKLLVLHGPTCMHSCVIFTGLSPFDYRFAASLDPGELPEDAQMVLGSGWTCSS